MNKLFVLLRPSLPHLDIRPYNLFPTQASAILHFSPTFDSSLLEHLHQHTNRLWLLLMLLILSFSTPPLTVLLFCSSTAQFPWKNCLYSLLPHLLLNPPLSSTGPKDLAETTYFKVSSNPYWNQSTPHFQLRLSALITPFFLSLHLAFGIPK